jgi:Flp pilus assembly protein TadG
MNIALKWAREERGAAAVEFALWLGVIVWPLLNVYDLGLYVFQKIQVDNAGQAAVQQLFNACGQTTASPILTNCSSAKVSNGLSYGIQSTSLGTDITVLYVTECVGGKLQNSGDYTADPSIASKNCPSSTGDYVAVTPSFTYHPLFKNVTVTSILKDNTSMGSIAWMKMS